MTDKISIYTPPYIGITSYYDVIDIACEFGLKNVETINSLELDTIDPQVARDLKAYADKKGIKFSCCSVAVNLVGENREAQIDYAKKYVEIVKILGSPYMHHTIALDTVKPGSNELIADYETMFYEGVEAVREIYDYAKQQGIRTLFEDQGYVFNGNEGFARFLKEVDRNVGVVYDFGNIIFADDMPEDFFETVKDRIVNVHVKDYIYTKKEERQREAGEHITWKGNYLRDCVFGKGTVDFKACMEKLKSIGYDGYFAIECQPLGGDEKAIFRHNIDFTESFIK